MLKARLANTMLNLLVPFSAGVFANTSQVWGRKFGVTMKNFVLGFGKRALPFALASAIRAKQIRTAQAEIHLNF